ncbi:hypothetical protein OG302_42575 [Streptomyces sp. NBC_01283]|nr:hypothetical protein OG302_42575 [Streptomyces sp. NBC_01283]
MTQQPPPDTDALVLDTASPALRPVDLGRVRSDIAARLAQTIQTGVRT